MRSLEACQTSYSAASCSIVFVTHTGWPSSLILRRSLLVPSAACYLDPCSRHNESGFRIFHPNTSREYAIHGMCGKSNGSLSTNALAACSKFGVNKSLRENSSACNGYDGRLRLRDYSHYGLGNCSRVCKIVCSTYGGEKSFYKKASLVSSRHGSYGDAEKSARESLFVLEGNTNPASANTEPPYVARTRYRAPRSHNRDSLSDLGNYASHESLQRASSTSYPVQNETVSVFWDLDNKPPQSSPYYAALSLRKAASQFGSVIAMVAYANHHAFTHVPEWVREQRRDRKQLDLLERRGEVQPEQPYVCKLCGRKCKTNILLKKHFKQLHEREHNKRINRLNSLKGKKRAKFKESVLSKTLRYKEAAQPILVPRVGYGLESDLRRAGVYVKTVQYKPQAADVALKQQMTESMNKGIKCLCLVSDDTDFAQMLVDARALNLRTVVFGESKSLKRFADLWLPWDKISQGMPVHDFQESIHVWTQHYSSIKEQICNIMAEPQTVSSGCRMYSGVSAESDVYHKIFAGSNPVRKASFSVFSEEETDQRHEEDITESFSEDGEEFAFEDVDNELDGDWKDDFGDGSIEQCDTS